MGHYQIKKFPLKPFLMLYHLVITCFIIYQADTLFTKGDSRVFINMAENIDSAYLLKLGTPMMALLIKPFVALGFNYIIITIVFSLISLKGFLILFDLIIENEPAQTKTFIAVLWLFLPSLHYWTSFIGKDVIFFMFAILVIRHVYEKRKVNFMFVIFCLAAFLVRPHSTLVVFLILFVYFFLTNRTIKSPKDIKFLTISFLFILGLSFVFVTNFKSLTGLSLNAHTLSDFYKSIDANYSENGSHYFSPSVTNIFEKVSLLMFRPLYFDAESKFQLIASIENSFIIIYMVFLIVKSKKKFIVNSLFYLSTGLCLMIFTSLYIFNLGQANRLRVMILPFIFFGLCITLPLNKTPK